MAIDDPLSAHEIDDEFPTVQFAHHLVQELDAIGFPTGAERSILLAAQLDRGRATSYKILKGTQRITPPLLLRLRKAGCSIDNILDGMLQAEQEVIPLKIDGHVHGAKVVRSRSKASGSLVAVPNEFGEYVLQTAGPESVAAEDVIAISSLMFPNLHNVAVVDDDANALLTLAANMSTKFNVSQFGRGGDLLTLEAGLNRYRAFVLDWQLPDITGYEMVSKIRSFTKAPIVILTGYTDAARTNIAEAMDLGNVFHVPKPANALLLIKLVAQEISRSQQ